MVMSYGLSILVVPEHLDSYRSPFEGHPRSRIRSPRSRSPRSRSRNPRSRSHRSRSRSPRSRSHRSRNRRAPVPPPTIRAVAPPNVRRGTIGVSEDGGGGRSNVRPGKLRSAPPRRSCLAKCREGTRPVLATRCARRTNTKTSVTGYDVPEFVVLLPYAVYPRDTPRFRINSSKKSTKLSMKKNHICLKRLAA